VFKCTLTVGRSFGLDGLNTRLETPVKLSSPQLSYSTVDICLLLAVLT